MIEEIKQIIERIDNLSKTKPIKVISHYDTDGITSAAIFSRALHRWGKTFSMQIVKSLSPEIISTLSEDNILIFLDLGSNSLDYLAKKNTEVFLLDHHEILQEIPKNVSIINPVLKNEEMISASGICYLFAKTLSEQNKDLATLAVIGMVGDLLERNLSQKYNEILNDSGTIIKKGLLLYPSTRPIDRVLEYSSKPYLPGITGSYQGVLEILRDSNLQKENGKYKALYEFSEEEMSNLTTSIMLRIPDKEHADFIGNLYLVKFFNKMEDARELSARINACSRMGYPEISLGFCLGNQSCMQKGEKIHIEYKQNIISALKYVSETEKIQGKNYTIINAKDHIKDTIIGTIASIISHSPAYSEGTIIIALAHNGDKIKVSARMTGKSPRNVRNVLNQVVVPLGGEVGGHPEAAGCMISIEKEQEFIQELRKILEVETITI